MSREQSYYTSKKDHSIPYQGPTFNLPIRVNLWRSMDEANRPAGTITGVHIEPLNLKTMAHQTNANAPEILRHTGNYSRCRICIDFTWQNKYTWYWRMKLRAKPEIIEFFVNSNNIFFNIYE